MKKRKNGIILPNGFSNHWQDEGNESVNVEFTKSGAVKTRRLFKAVYDFNFGNHGNITNAFWDGGSYMFFADKSKLQVAVKTAYSSGGTTYRGWVVDSSSDYGPFQGSQYCDIVKMGSQVFFAPNFDGEEILRFANDGAPPFHPTTARTSDTDVLQCGLIEDNSGVLFAARTKEDGVFYPTRIRWSAFGEPQNFEPFDTGNFQNYEDIGTDDDEIMRIVAVGGDLFILKQKSIWIASGLTAGGFVGPEFIKEIFKNIGVIAPKAVCKTANGFFFVSKDGLYSYTGGKLKKEDLPLWLQLGEFVGKGYDTDIVLEYNEKNKELWLIVPTNGNIGPVQEGHAAASTEPFTPIYVRNDTGQWAKWAFAIPYDAAGASVQPSVYPSTPRSVKFFTADDGGHFDFLFMYPRPGGGRMDVYTNPSLEVDPSDVSTDTLVAQTTEVWAGYGPGINRYTGGTDRYFDFRPVYETPWLDLGTPNTKLMRSISVVAAVMDTFVKAGETYPFTVTAFYDNNPDDVRSEKTVALLPASHGAVLDGTAILNGTLTLTTTNRISYDAHFADLDGSCRKVKFRFSAPFFEIKEIRVSYIVRGGI
jgi:hypothetical protein